ncbi:Xaa-Pro dipeptidyl-peptidase [Limosilactobacillus fastidiosus]|uniref:Xaa-Pro dipeptidyl-peptidase n=1 Tax=Limosilactobacillus fastidiosus TaxID=2759855 RepID=A0A7W3TYW7_9LACO|nr:Xaa-Pro dipeptidyl-peptidase [Limosilactobacillus fastidiosus]MBB1063454.1 Xaa-Pro dipeptidyl-peptidase [Limosilactobacillus fastidiosus]MBB1085854.1 Xaa-Pro dipeptidyl-peptidase [Limosilactobacillus fastidiosus]MCD7084722.1 Xaa-Pro dipeptidyl-peptidase [Limosilactobacillus fastidiosus]MCD7085809.1 Xaa-Pro dipeptidyl-peptidase [Limosilactobacillus fastidiosus]MCD7113886.1 Xaa-Pro dipeptidyl-peptidase [Limosilactobacillus fastidiosus]
MRINQYSIAKTSLEQKFRELKKLHLLRGNEAAELDPSQMWLTLLARTHMASEQPIAIRQWLHDFLATPDLAIDEWLEHDLPLTTEVFYFVAFQLLHFEPGVDFNIDHPLKDWAHIGLPFNQHTSWSTADVLEAFYLLLNTRTKDGQSFIDQLTSEGFMAWSYRLPPYKKPIYFNGKPLASFDPAKFIREVVYVETDMDTDYDGKADLIKVEILRPSDSNNSLKVPAVFTASPYNQGTNDEWGEKVTHHVNHPLTHKNAGEVAPAEPKFPQHFTHQEIKGESKHATESFAETPAYTLNNYLAARGYAIVYSAGIGTKDSDGLQTCGSPEQTDSMKAVVEWLHGDRVAFTDRHSGIQIKAWWCNGNVAMTGRSYLGTLATAVATTAVPGLKAIISEAAISSWYDYYRENGLVRAPGGFQGEDADVLADETFSRTKRPADYHRIEKTNNKYIAGLAKAMDRKTGNYNDFWASRNYRPAIKNIKAAVMMVHGLNDTNVKPSNVKALYDGLQELPVTSKLVLHQGQHIYINAFQSLDFSEMVNLWLANKLWDQDNHADETLPKVLVQDNTQPETWWTYDQWTAGSKKTLYFNKTELTENDPQLSTEYRFNDQQTPETFEKWCKNINDWQNALVKDNGKFSYHLKTAPVDQDLLLRGTPEVNVTVAASTDHGMISVQLVDFGNAKRLTISPVLMNHNGLQLGFHWASDDLREFKLQSNLSNFKVIADGHINLQNRHSAAEVDDLSANQFVKVHFKLQPIFHHLLKGHQLGLIIYSTDFGATLRGNEKITYTIKTKDSFLMIPGVTSL